MESSMIETKHIGTDYSYKHKILWKNAFGLLILHLLALWGFILVLTGNVHILTFPLVIFIGYICGEGITIGAHRLFSHKSFSATSLLKAILILAQTMAGQNSMFTWCRDHRLHHRFSDTDGDPHNAQRGFLFSHIGWLMMEKHPYVIEFGRKIDMSDLESDWMVMAQKKYYFYLYFVFAVFLPVWLPVYLFGDMWWKSFLVSYFLRYVLVLNGTWLVNSATHIYGTRPYDKNLLPAESWFLSLISLGEGWHNYHHTFPWDYKAAELSMHFNLSAKFIRFFERIGLASNLKTVSPEMISNRIIRTGDGTHYELGNDEARSRITAFGPLHPMNPFYTTKSEATEAKNREEDVDAKCTVRNKTVGSSH